MTLASRLSYCQGPQRGAAPWAAKAVGSEWPGHRRCGEHPVGGDRPQRAGGHPATLPPCTGCSGDGSVARVLHTERRLPGQSQVLRIEAFGCVYRKKIQPHSVLIQRLAPHVYTSFSECGSPRNP